MVNVHSQECEGIQEWINNITCCLKEGDYKNRSKLQK